MITSDEEISDILRERFGFDLPAETIEGLKEERYFDDIRKGEPHAVEDAMEAVRRWFARAGHPLRREEPPVMMHANRKPRNLPLRVEAVSVLMAAEAARDEGVVHFRKTVLREKLLPPEGVESWIEEQKRKDGPPWSWLRFPLLDSRIQSRKGLRLRLKPAVTELTPPWGRSWSTLRYANPGDRFERAAIISANGFLEKLRLLSESLAKRFTWRPTQATLFVLTGTVPIISLARFEYQLKTPAAASRITMIIDPILSPAEVAERYGKERRRVMDGRYRNLSDKHLRLAIFMADRPAGETLRQSMTAWNKQFREWKYKQETNFGRDTSKARQRLLYPALNLFPRELYK